MPSLFEHPNLRPAIGAITMAVLKEYGTMWLDWRLVDHDVQLILCAPDRGALGFRRVLKWKLEELIRSPDPVDAYRAAVEGVQARVKAREAEMTELRTKLERLRIEQEAEDSSTMTGLLRQL